MTDQPDLRRSRSRGRSTLNNEFRIRDENVSTTKNIKTTDYPTRPHRSLSRLSHPTKPSDNQLLQQAIQNHNFRNSSPAPEIQRVLSKGKTNSIRSLNESRTRSRNIPMVPENDLRPAMKRWNSIQYLSSDNNPGNVPNMQSNDKYLDPNSISPLTVIKDQYDTRRPVSNFVASADNHFKDLQSPSESPELLHTDELNKTNTTTPAQSITNKIYNKMVKLIHGDEEGFNTIPDEILAVAGPDSGSVSTSQIPVKYQSESDDESEDDTRDTTGQFGSWQSPNVNLNEAPPMEDINLDTIMDEINDFQNNFVQKYNATTPQIESTHSSRIQQKILDHRDLHTQDENLTKTPSYFSLNSSHSTNSSNVFSEHTFRIQHETIMQQYNQIRLRFANATDFDLYTIDQHPIPSTKTSQPYLRSNVGALGFLNRKTMMDGKMSPDSDWHKLQSIHGTDSEVNPSLVHKIWYQELNELFPDENPPGTPKTPTFHLGTGTNSQGSSVPHSPLALSNKTSFDVNNRLTELTKMRLN